MSAAKKNFKKSNNIIGYDPEKRKETQENRAEKIEGNSQKKPNSLRKTMLDVFKSKKTRKEYFQFLKSMFKK